MPSTNARSQTLAVARAADATALPARDASAAQSLRTEYAILCAGLDRVRRGYETHTRTLFDALSRDARPGMRFTLFKRAGRRAPGEVALRTPYREGFLCRLLAHAKGDALFWESVFFAIGFAAYTVLARRRFEKLVVIEPVVAKLLHAVLPLLPGRPRLLFTHGVCNPPDDYAAVADEFHEVNIENFRLLEDCLARAGGSNRPRSLVPHFIADEGRAHDVAALRAHYRIATPRVLLSVGAVEGEEKRMDYVIDEAMKLGDDWTLVLCGKAVDRKLLERAKRGLGDRFLHLFKDHGEIEEVYRLADVFVTASLREGFGIVILEAMRAGLPVVTHRRELFEWILRSADTCIDLRAPGALAEFLARSPVAWLRAVGLRNRAIFEEAYTWEAAKDAYYAMLTWQPPLALEPKEGDAVRHRFRDAADLAVRTYHRVFSRYFPRKLRRRIARRLCRAVGLTYPRPGPTIGGLAELLANAPPRAVVFIAHPDDETFCSGLLCALREAGAEVVLCCLTRGEGGYTGGFTRDRIGAVRERELRNAARALGIDQVRFLGCIDPVATAYRNYAPQIEGNRLLSQIRRVLGDERPGLVITHGSCGEYWHPAHILLHDHVVKAVGQWSAGNPPGPKLLTFNAWQEDHPLGNCLNESDRTHLRIDGSRFQAVRLSSLLAHETQRDVFRIFGGGSVEDFISRANTENYHLVGKHGARLRPASSAHGNAVPLSHPVPAAP